MRLRTTSWDITVHSGRISIYPSYFKLPVRWLRSLFSPSLGLTSYEAAACGVQICSRQICHPNQLLE